MPIWMLIALYLAGVVLVLLAASRLVALCMEITRHWGVKSLALGSTLVAMATSLPEFTIVTIAVLTGRSDLAIGNILGANILNIGMVLGVSSTLNPLKVSETSRRRELPLALGVLALFFLFALDRRVGRPEGLLMLALMGGYLWIHLRSAVGDVRAHRLNQPSDQVRPSVRATVLKTAASVAALFGGGLLVVATASGLAEAMGISQLTIGVVLVSMSTTIPEMAASAASSYHGEPEISLANVVGSNNFNILVCAGFVAVLSPIAVNPAALRVEFPVAFAFYGLLIFLFYRGRSVLSRAEGVLLLACYSSFVAWLLLFR